MSTTSANNKRIAKNTLLLYLRTSLLILVQLYTVPIILKALGAKDYGIYNVVGGMVTMFAFIGGALTSGSQRFIAIEIGRRDKKRLKKIFDTTVTIYLILALAIGFLLEIGGCWFLNTQMNIPTDRLYAANWVLQLSILAFLINLVSIPYNAAVIAHERMSLYAYISILECGLKLIATIALQYVLLDKLILYAVFICMITVSVRIIYQLYCRKHFEECRHYRFSGQTYMGKDLLAYSGWNMIGAVALISRQQGVNIVINLFFGPLLNAAHSIAQHINGVFTQFVNNIYIASRPQITKSYASGQVGEMWKLVFRSSKLAFFLLMLICVPVLIEMDFVLKWWLHDVPTYTVSIARLMILSILIETLGNQVIGVYQAANKIRRYQLYSSTIILFNVPLSYLLLRITPNNPIIPYIVSVSLSILYVFSILWNARREIGLNLETYLKEVLLRDVIICILTLGFVWGSTLLLSPSLFRAFLTVLLTLACSALFAWKIGLDSKEKVFVKNIIKQKISRK